VIGILARRGDSFVTVWGIPVSRLVRESLLTRSFVLEIYDRVSQEAEALE
jgi:hypothetical protein